MRSDLLEGDAAKTEVNGRRPYGTPVPCSPEGAAGRCPTLVGPARTEAFESREDGFFSSKENRFHSNDENHHDGSKPLQHPMSVPVLKLWKDMFMLKASSAEANLTLNIGRVEARPGQGCCTQPPARTPAGPAFSRLRKCWSVGGPLLECWSCVLLVLHMLYTLLHITSCYFP